MPCLPGKTPPSKVGPNHKRIIQHGRPGPNPTQPSCCLDPSVCHFQPLPQVFLATSPFNITVEALQTAPDPIRPILAILTCLLHKVSQVFLPSSHPSSHLRTFLLFQSSFTLPPFQSSSYLSTLRITLQVPNLSPITTIHRFEASQTCDIAISHQPIACA